MPRGGTFYCSIALYPNQANRRNTRETAHIEAIFTLQIALKKERKETLTENAPLASYAVAPPVSGTSDTTNGCLSG